MIQGRLCSPMYCSPPGPCVHGILQAKILEWIAVPFSRGSSQPRDQTRVSYIAGRFFTAEPLVKIKIAFVYRKIFKSNKLKRKTFVKVGKKNAAGFGPGLGWEGSGGSLLSHCLPGGGCGQSCVSFLWISGRLPSASSSTPVMGEDAAVSALLPWALRKSCLPRVVSMLEGPWQGLLCCLLDLISILWVSAGCWVPWKHGAPRTEYGTLACNRLTDLFNHKLER